MSGNITLDEAVIKSVRPDGTRDDSQPNSSNMAKRFDSTMYAEERQSAT